MASEIGISTGIKSAFRLADASFGSSNKSDGGSLSFLIARVSFVLLDDSNKEKFNKYGGWKGIGTIECKTFINNNSNEEILSALPINSKITQYPVINEIVLIVRGVSYNAQNSLENFTSQYYYISTIPVWNSNEHNIVPGEIKDENELKNIGGLFKVTGKVNRIIKAPGDITIEGRSGNLIRFGSSIDNFNSPYSGENRSPFLSIVNKPHDVGDNKIGIYEDINLDGSSLYMLSGQSVGLKVSSLNFDSYKFKIKKEVLSNYIQPVIQRVEQENDKGLQDATDEVQELKEVVNENTIVRPSTNSVNQSDEEEFVEGQFSLSDVEDEYDDLNLTILDINGEAELPSGKSINVPVYTRKPTSAVARTPTAPPVKKEEEKEPPSFVGSNTGGLNDKIIWEVQRDGVWCFVTSVAVLLKSYGIKTSQEDIGRDPFVVNQGNNNMYANNIPKKFPGVTYKKYLLPTSDLKLSDGSTISGRNRAYYELLKICSIRGNKPFILEQKGSSPTHFVVVRGAVGNKIYVWDSGKRAYNPKNKGYENGKLLEPDNLKANGGSVRFFDEVGYTNPYKGSGK